MTETSPTLLGVFYSDVFPLPLPPDHRFPADKYRELRESLQHSDFSDRLDLRIAPAATDEQLLLVHSPEYLSRLKTGELSRLEQREIGFPWSAEMLERCRRSAGGTIAAARRALVGRAGVHLAGGTHHAFPDRGQGFCVFNDVALAIHVLQSEGTVGRAVVIDLDVHQGNGTAAIFSGDDRVFTFSMHGARNFPFEKFGSDLDIALPDGAGDEAYLATLGEALPSLPLPDADIVFYLAGADVHELDRYGKLRLTDRGVAARDHMVVAAVKQAGVPLTVVMAGGYAAKISDIVRIHANTVRIVADEYFPAAPRQHGA